MSWGYRNPRHLWIRKYKHCGNLEKSELQKFQVICSECESVCVCV